ncbi:branched-chain amino acid ABC transporter permease [Bradyrhizobium sp. KBS0727]|jgi:branched-chain amino acid transport system permease protein|uniref:branched-chain amino acid ABC transporter permease n=1 Tax=unclassified Bradyrhizobium TaxID=2631580 RepID=UPI00110D9905|nr:MULTISPECIES: branched-chain amino acid ABC transporter permease [unclassified Bradyrhizobium]QDW37297.1 branched-chain amino acid ABC transporter permease [Bradyrhizobium sp. KBS0725]QDW43900.1 branched-chain amino acid ABC transporter permease [Bradyrhizobium sp. KBS0727]
MSFLSAIITGMALGSMYGLLALGFHVTYAVSGTVNFSQGSSMTLGAVAGYFFLVVWGWPAAIGIPAVLLVCAVYGVLIERFAVRPFVERGSDNWLMATVAVGIIVDNVMLFVFGKEPRSFPSVLAAKPIQIVEGAGVYPLQLLIPVVGLLLALALHLISRRTRHGVAMLAVVQNPNAARLMGINVSGAIATSYAVSAVLAGVAALLIAPLFNVSSEMGTLFGIKAFAAAIIGGLASSWGVMLAGLCLGLIEVFATNYLGSVYTQIITFASVIVILVLMPHGLLGRAGVKKV